MDSQQKTALVTGGGRGIGLGIALQLAQAGFRLAISGRRPTDDVQESLAAIRAFSPQSIYVKAEIASSQERQEMVEAVRQQFGRLDVLVNNAGMAPRTRADVLESTEESFDEVMATNLKGPYFLTQTVAAWMIRQAEADASFAGTIINISSISSTVASVTRGDYCLSKAGISMATQLWAVRLAEYGIGVYEIRPGIIETDMTKGVKGKYDALIESGLLLEKRWGTPEDVGKAVRLLAERELSYATGAVLVLDGGLTVARL